MNDYTREFMHYATGTQVRGHKYIDRIKTRAGRWRYVYEKKKSGSKFTEVYSPDNKESTLGIPWTEVVDNTKRMEDDLNEYGGKDWRKETNEKALHKLFTTAYQSGMVGYFNDTSYGEQFVNGEHKEPNFYINSAKRIAARVYADIKASFKDNPAALKYFSKPECKKELVEYAGALMRRVYDLYEPEPNLDAYKKKSTDSLPGYAKDAIARSKTSAQKTKTRDYSHLPGYAKDAIAKSKASAKKTKTRDYSHLPGYAKDAIARSKKR